jgi:hypothetical protein
MKGKFTDVLEDVLTSQRTSPVVRERLLDVLAAAAYASSATPLKNESSFRLLWRKVKPPGKPDEVGIIPCLQVRTDAPSRVCPLILTTPCSIPPRQDEAPHSAHHLVTRLFTRNHYNNPQFKLKLRRRHSLKLKPKRRNCRTGRSVRRPIRPFFSA